MLQSGGNPGYKFHTNLYAAFIKRCYELTGADGKIAMIHPHTFMFIKTFEDVRKFMIEKCHIDVMVDFGLDRVNLFGPGILLDAAFYVLSKNKNDNEGLYFNLTTNLQEKFKKAKFIEAFNDYIADISNDRVYTLEQSKLKIIKSWPFIYWISDEFRVKFKKDLIKTSYPPKSGLATSNNNRFLRFWWEIESGSWKEYSKGGPFKKWFGNLWLRVNWKNNASEMRSTGNAVFRNEDYYFREGITYSASGSKGASFRYLPTGCVYDVGGASLFPLANQSTYYTLGLLNTKLSQYIINCLNPTVNTQVGDIERLPYILPSKKELFEIELLVKRNIEICKLINSHSILEDNFVRSVLEEKLKLGFTSAVKYYLYTECHLCGQLLINEAIINEKIFEVYDLTEHDKAVVLSKEGESIGGLPVAPEARDDYLAETEATKEFPLDNIRDYIESLPTREFTAEEQEKVESGFPALYQNNNDLEEFCIRNKVNPINVWYWFKKSNVIPQQRMNTLAMEFLVDIVREILMEDQDGIIPLVPNAEGKVLLDRIEAKFMEKGLSMAQYSNFDKLLGRPIHEYLNRHFFAELSDHLNLFMYLPKTPFIWHLSSGPDQGFDCYIIIYKWSRDKLMRLRSVYIENRERALINRQSDLNGNLSAEAQNEKDRIFKQLKEIEDFKTKIDELLAEGYNPILDDGVGKNIAPLQKKKMIPYEVLNDGQLKKYLNADW